jgi:hypothetical protein
MSARPISGREETLQKLASFELEHETERAAIAALIRESSVLPTELLFFFSCAALNFTQRAHWAVAILLRAAADIVRFF